MASVNKVILVGHLGRDPEMRWLPNGDAVANLAIATSYRSKNKDTGEVKEFTEWSRITLFGRLAEVAGQYLKKGSCAYIEGRLQTRKYTDKDGIEKYATDVIAENLQLLDKQERSGPGFNEQSTPMHENTGRAQQDTGYQPPADHHQRQRQQQDNRTGQHRAEQNSREQNRNRQYNQGGHHG